MVVQHCNQQSGTAWHAQVGHPHLVLDQHMVAKNGNIRQRVPQLVGHL
jgi:hypothetical protein